MKTKYVSLFFLLSLSDIFNSMGNAKLSATENSSMQGSHELTHPEFLSINQVKQSNSTSSFTDHPQGIDENETNRLHHRSAPVLVAMSLGVETVTPTAFLSQEWIPQKDLSLWPTWFPWPWRPTPTKTPTRTPTRTPTLTSTPTPSPISTNTPSPASTPTSTNTPSPTLTPTSTNTSISTPTVTNTPSPTETGTPTPTATSSASAPTHVPTPTPILQLTINPSLTVNATDFGAIANDTTDDLDAIQSAINYVASQGGGTVAFSPGTFLIRSRSSASDGSIRMESHIALRGSGMGSTVIKLRDNDHGDITGLIRNPVQTVKNNWIIQDLTLDGNRANNTGRVIGFFCGTLPGSLDTVENIRCLRVEIQNCMDYGFDPHERTTHLSLIDCLAHDNGLDGFTIDYSMESEIRGCRSWNNGRHGFNVVTDSYSITMSDCLAESNGGNGLMIQNRAHHVTILNCAFKNNLLNGINIREIDFVWIEDCDIHGNQKEGITLRGSGYIYVAGNNLLNNGLLGGYNDIKLDEYNSRGTQNCMIYYNSIYSLSSKRTKYGVYEVSGLQDYNVVTQNDIQGQLTGTVYLTGIHSKTTF